MPEPVVLSLQQQHVVDHRGSDLQVIACAGSGKTESVSRRLASLIAEGAEPASIAAFTFTERAATELKERIVRRVAERMGPAFRDRLGPMFVGTIHAYCFRVLQDHVPRYGNYDVLDEHRHAAFLSREYHRLGLGKLKARHWAPIRDFMRTVDVIGNEVIPASALAGTPLGECYHAYRDALDRSHFLTFGLLIACPLEALEGPAVHARVSAPLRHLFVDEYQDVNPAQERLIDLLARPPVQLTVVGDDDQSIYQWRGSDLRNILTFRQRRPTSASVQLDTNRRSRPAIVSAANVFARSIPDRLPKQMQPVREAGENEVVAWSTKTDDDEAERIAETVQRLEELGYRYRDMAVLYRSVRTSAPPLIDAFRALDIPYTAAGRTGLFLQPEVAFLAEIYAWFVDGDWRDDRFAEFRPANLDRIVAGLDRVFGNGARIADLHAYLEDWRAFVLRGHRPVNLVGDYYRLLRVLGVHAIDLSSPSESASLDVSFSDLAVFEECGHRYRLGHASGFQTLIAPELGYGRAIHHVLRHVADVVRTSGRLPDTPALDRLVAEEFFVPFASPQAWETMRRAARRLVAAYVSDYNQDLQRVWAAERPFALHLDQGTVSGRADVILDREGGRVGALAIVDYKVAADEGRGERHHEQLRVYTLAGRGEGLTVDAAYLHGPRDGTRRAVDISEGACRAAFDLVSDRLVRLRQGQFAAVPETSRCRSCEYRAICGAAKD